MTMRRASLLSDTSAQAAAEMMLVLPMLLALMFGAGEVGYYFYQEHVLVDAVRDGARFAARQPPEEVSCAGIDSDTETSIKTATRLISPGALDTAENRRITYWDSNDSVTVTVSCPDNDGFEGLYVNMAELPRVRVAAEVGYQSLFSFLGLGNLTLSVEAASEAAVVGA